MLAYILPTRLHTTRASMKALRGVSGDRIFIIISGLWPACSFGLNLCDSYF